MRLAKRVLIPRWWISLRCFLKFRAKVSPRAEVEFSRYLQLGKATKIGSFTKVKSADGPLKIGQRTSVATGGMIGSHTGGVEIGEDCLIGPNVSIVAANYKYDRLDVPIRVQGYESKGIRIADDVFLGAGVVVLDGATIGKGAIVAPNSVVTGKIPDNAIAQGNPAKVVFVRR